MKILLVEDDPISAIAVQMLLTHLGHSVTVEEDGARGWRSLEKSPVPVAILDWMMPVMDGIELCKKIKSSPTLSKTCIIMLTAKRRREDRLTALRAGVDVFLCKPLDQEDLVARLQIAQRIIDMGSKPERADLENIPAEHFASRQVKASSTN